MVPLGNSMNRPEWCVLIVHSRLLRSRGGDLKLGVARLAVGSSPLPGRLVESFGLALEAADGCFTRPAPFTFIL